MSAQTPANRIISVLLRTSRCDGGKPLQTIQCLETSDARIPPDRIRIEPAIEGRLQCRTGSVDFSDGRERDRDVQQDAHVVTGLGERPISIANRALRVT